MRKETAPEKRESTMQHSKGDSIYTHPAFGTVVVTHWTGGGSGTRLFGSDLGHNSGITLSFRTAELHRSLANDSIYPQDHILEVDLSESQWARLVASTGNGNGTPVTIRELCVGGKYEDVPAIAAPEASKREVHGEEMKVALQKALKAATDGIAQLGQLLEGSGPIRKSDLKAIHRAMELPIGHLPGNVQFIYDQFAEATERAAEDAKLEIEAHVAGMAEKLGLEQLRDIAPRLEQQS